MINGTFRAFDWGYPSLPGFMVGLTHGQLPHSPSDSLSLLTTTPRRLSRKPHESRVQTKLALCANRAHTLHESNVNLARTLRKTIRASNANLARTLRESHANLTQFRVLSGEMMNFTMRRFLVPRHGSLHAMKLCLCGQSALTAWRHYENGVPGTPVFGHTPNAGPVLPAALPRRTLAPELNLQSLRGGKDFASSFNLSRWGIDPDEAVHILTTRENKARPSTRATVHTISQRLPKGSILRLDQHVCVVSPEYHLVRTAADSDLLDTCLLAYELCGCYAIRPELPGGLLQRHPLCCANSIESFLAKSEGLRGHRQAQTALAYVRDGSGSPRETALTLLLCLPQHRGGFGLPFPTLNLHLNLGMRGKALWGKGNAFDLVWKEQRLVVEYDGSVHASEEGMERDSRRRDALASEGYTLFVITKSQLSSSRGTFSVAKSIADVLGKRLRIRNKNAFREKHLELRRRTLAFQT